MNLLRCIRFDISDTKVFPLAAEPGEWALPGGFVFADADPEKLERRERQAFANGFLGLGSFGWSSLVSVAPAGEEDVAEATAQLVAHLMARFNAPSEAEAQRVAEAEIAAAIELAALPIHTLLSVSRSIEGEDIREQFRIVTPPGEKPHARVWEIAGDE